MWSVPKRTRLGSAAKWDDRLRSSPWPAAKAGTALLGAILLLAGCAAPELGGATPPPLPSAYAGAEGAAPVVQRDLTGWWHSFRDPTLDRLVAKAAANNLSVAQARARLAAGRAQASAAQTLFLPTAGAGGTAIAATPKTENDDPMRRPLMAGYDMSWDVGLFGLSENTGRAADAGAAMLADDLEAVRVAMVAEVASAYISLRATQQQEAIAVALIAAQRQRLEAADALVGFGLATPAADVEPTARLAELESEQAQLAARAKGLQQQIATLLGTATPDVALIRSGAQPQSNEAPRTSRPADLLRARPDVRAAEQKVLQAAAEVGIAQAGLYPHLRLVGSLGVGAPFTSSAFGAAGGPVLEIPLLDYGRRQAAVSARQSLYDEAVAGYRQSVLQAYREAVTAEANWSASRTATARQRSALAASERTVREIRVLQQEGLANRSRAADADAAVLERRRLLITARETEALSLTALYMALGGATPVAASAGGRP